MSKKVISKFSTAPTPPLCESGDSTDSSYEAYVIRLSVNKLENKKHTSRLRNTTLIRSVHQRALQTALSSSLTWERNTHLQESCASTAIFDADTVSCQLALSKDSLPELDSSGTASTGPSIWDMVDAWEASRKRSDDVLMDEDEDAEDIPKRLCLGIDGLDEDTRYFSTFDWESPVLVDV